MAKMYQVDKMAIMATMAKMAFQLGTLLNHEYKVNQIESIKMGMSSKIVLKNAANLPRFNLIVCRGKSAAISGQKKTPCKQLARGVSMEWNSYYFFLPINLDMGQFSLQPCSCPPEIAANVLPVDAPCVLCGWIGELWRDIPVSAGVQAQ